ncbi:MAG: carbamoyltransferase [Bacteroidia bacterium]
MAKILGISAFYHDAAAALTVDGEIVAAAQEERFDRVKHTAGFPENAIKYCLGQAGIEPEELNAVVFYEKPLLKFERILETHYAFAPGGLSSFIHSMPLWMGKKLFLKKHIRDGLNNIGRIGKNHPPLLFSQHHLSHAASAFFPSGFEQAAILTIDGVGEWATATIGQGNGKKLILHKEMRFPHSVGLLYSAFTYYLGFRVNSGEYKLMGLAPYGDPESPQTTFFKNQIRTHMISLKDDGSVWLNHAYFGYATGLRMVREKRWQKLLGFPRREPESVIEPHHSNLALAIQQITEEIVMKMAVEAKKITGSSHLCLAGGVALNGVAAGKLLHSGLYDKIYIQPAAGDAGGALGAALAAHHIYFGEDRIFPLSDPMKGALLGPDFTNAEIELAARMAKIPYDIIEDLQTLSDFTASRLAAGKVVGWFQGRMEFGPRALGNRSILADPRSPEMQSVLNHKIKKRESFRPFAPAVLWEDAETYFELKHPSPYMSFVVPVKEEKRKELPAVTHLDYSARVQTVHRETNERFWQLLQAFKKRTGCSVLVNTSFNVRGEPIVCTPEEAIRCFLQTEMDMLVAGNYVFSKETLR